MYTSFKFFLLVYCVFLNTLPTRAFAADAVLSSDIALLIDVSGSMKQNDPHNLRIPALELFINLLPPETKAGIWLFAEDSSVLVASGVADAEWKKQALASIGKIHSHGKFTNIESVLHAALPTWPGKSPNETRNIILLTDGVVDVAKDSAKNAASKARILTELIPTIQETGAHIQTIALSKQADSELLQKLAFTTNGWSETVESAKQLERIFLKMFKQVAPQESVPLVGNKFTVDGSIKEFSVMVFKKPGAATELLSPDQQKITHTTSSDQTHWVNETNYDLITIKNPLVGEWQILGDMDPDNQVLILTDLKLELNDTPLYKTALEALTFDAHFSDKGLLIDHDDFLNVVKLNLQQIDSAGQIKDYPLAPQPTQKGHFSAIVAEPLAKGNYTFKLLADGKTFTREVTRNVAVVDAPITLKSTVDQAKRQVTLTLTPDPTLIDPATLTLNAAIHQVTLETITLPMTKQGEVWQITVDAPEKGSEKIVNFAATAKTLQGSAVEPALQPFLVDEQLFNPDAHAPDPAKVEAEEKNTHDTSEHNDEEAADTQTQSDEKAVEDPPKKDSPDWLMTSLLTVAINLVFIAVGFAGYRMHKKSAAKKQALLLDRLT